MLPKTSTYVKDYDGKTNWIYFLIKDDDLLNKYNTNWVKLALMLKYNLMTNLYTIKYFGELKQNFTVMKVQIFRIRKHQK